MHLPILESLSGGGTLTTQEITRAVRRKLDLQQADLESANKRGNEQKIDQIVANALQEKRQLCRDGLIERVSEGVFRLTPKGKDFVARFLADLELGLAWLNEHYPDLE